MTVKEKFKLPMNLQLFSEEPEATDEPTEPETIETVEEPVETEPADNAELETLKATVIDLTKQITELTAKQAEPEEPTETEVEKEVEPDPQLAVYEATLNKVVKEKLSAIPEGIASLMPDNLTAVEKLDWVEKAAKAVPVKEETVEPEKPVVESIGKPTPVPTEKEIDVTKLSPSQKMQLFFEEQFNKK